MESRMVGGSNQTLFDPHFFTFATMSKMPFMVPERSQRGSGGLPSEKLYKYNPYNAEKCPLTSIAKLVSENFNLLLLKICREDKTGHQMNKMQSYDWAWVGEIFQLGRKSTLCPLLASLLFANDCSV